MERRNTCGTTRSQSCSLLNDPTSCGTFGLSIFEISQPSPGEDRLNLYLDNELQKFENPSVPQRADHSDSTGRVYWKL